jgi:hypothetical protein
VRPTECGESSNPQTLKPTVIQESGAWVLRSHSLSHECVEELLPLLTAYRDAVNRVLVGVWSRIEWEKKKLNGKKQWRLLPKYTVNVHSREYKKELRDRLLVDWPYAAHWVDSATKVAYSILKTWRKNHRKGDRKRRRPTARRLSARVKQTLLKLEGERLRVTVKPEEYVYLDPSRRYFPLPGEVSSAGLGEPIITPEKIHLPVHYEAEGSARPGVAWDFNLLSLDGYSPETGWVRIDTSHLASIHISSFEKRRSVQRKGSRSKKAGGFFKSTRREKGIGRGNTSSRLRVWLRPFLELLTWRSSPSRGCFHGHVFGTGGFRAVTGAQSRGYSKRKWMGRRIREGG